MTQHWQWAVDLLRDLATGPCNPEVSLVCQATLKEMAHGTGHDVMISCDAEEVQTA